MILLVFYLSFRWKQKEHALLRQQLIVLERQMSRPQLSWQERGIIVLQAIRLRSWKEGLLIVQADTVLRWHRDPFRLVRRRISQPKQQGRRSADSPTHPPHGPREPVAGSGAHSGRDAQTEYESR
jgi:hypothetical protein